MKISFNPSNSNKNILDLIKNNKDIIFDLKEHSIFARGVEFKGTDTNTWRPVVDNLTSDSTTSSLSAKQGKVLKALIDGKSNSDHNHDGRYVRYYAVTTLDCNNLAAGLTAARIPATNAAHPNNSAYLYISDVGTPFQIQIPDSSIPYIYKRYYGSGKWSEWFKLNAGYADSAGSVAWANVTNKPSTFNPAAHTHTVFKNNLMIKGTNGISDSASIHLGIGDSDTGFKWISDGVCQIYADNAAVGQWTSGGMNWFKNPTVNGNKVWNAGNDGSGSGLDADTVDGYHAESFVKMYTGRFDQHNKGTWTKILQFTITSRLLQPTISFIWHPTECARDVWADFNINIRSGSPIFYVNWKGTTRRTVYCVGDGTTYSVWVQGTKSDWDPFGLVQVISAWYIDTYQAGSLQYSDSEPTGTYKVVASMSGIIMYADRLLTSRSIWGQSFDGTRDVSGTLSGVANIQFSADGAYDIGSNSATSRYIYTNWLGAKSGSKLELGANNSGFGQGLCIDTNLNVGIGTNTPSQKLDVHGNIRATGQIIREGSGQSWVNGRNGALLRETSAVDYHTLWSLKTTDGSWDFGEYDAGSDWSNIPLLSYVTDYNYNSGNNATTYQIKFPLASGTVALTSNIPNPTNYYWANVKISASSSTTTSPTVFNLTANSIRMGNILLAYTNEINNSANDSIYLNRRSSGGVSLCAGGGKVGIGTDTPTQKLDVRGYTHTNSFGIGIQYLSETGLLPVISPGDGYMYRCLEIGRSTKASCIIADKVPLSGVRGILLRFMQGFDGQIVVLKDLENYGSGNGSFWVMPSGCDIVNADNSDILIPQYQIRDTYNDSRSRFLIYSSKYNVWIEFFCSNIY